MNKEKTLGLLSGRICEQCAQDPHLDSVIKHGCCQHFVDDMWQKFHNAGQQSPSSYSPPHSRSLQFNQCVASAPTYGKAVVSTTTPTSLLPMPAIFTFPSNFFCYTGQRFRFTASGILGTTLGRINTVAIDLRFGPTIICTTGAINFVPSTQEAWILQGVCAIRSLGSGIGTNNIYNCVFRSNAVRGKHDWIWPRTQSANGIVSSGWDCTTTQQVNLYATWSIADPANTIQLLDYSLELMN